MHAEFASQADQWGGWVLGDLTIALHHAVEVVGPSAEVVSLSAELGDDSVARVRLLVTDLEEVARLRSEAESGEYVASFVDRPSAWSWEAEVHGIRLHVALGMSEETVEIFQGGLS